MASNLLQLVQEFCRRRGLPQPPGTVTGAQDDTTQQIWGLLNEGISELADRFEWPMLRTRFEFTHSSYINIGTAGDQYLALWLSENGVPGAGAPVAWTQYTLPDCKAILNRTLWDTDGRREVFGPMDPKSWELLLNLEVSQAVYNFSVFGNGLYIYPVPDPIGDTTFSLEYISKYGVVLNVEGVDTYTETFTDDGANCRLPQSLMLADLKWRWSAAKGLSYAEDYRACETMIQNLISRDPAPDIIMDKDRFSNVAAPGLLIAAGSWNIT